MTKIRVFVALSWLAFIVGLIAMVVSSIPGSGGLIGWFMFDHGLVILDIIVASYTLRRPRPSMAPFRWPGARRVLSPSLVVAGLVALSMYLVSRHLMPVDLLLASGHRLRVVSTDAVDASGAGAVQAQQAFVVFARAGVGFAFVGLCLWHIVSLREQQALEPSTPVSPAAGIPLPTRERADAQERTASQGRAVIVAIWALALAWSMLAMWTPPARDLCAAPFPWQFALVPPFFFTLSGLFAKRAPYNVPWFAEIVDSRLGAGATLRFLVSLKPMLLLALCAGCGSLAVRHSCAASGVESSFMPLFFASGGLGFVLLYAVLRLRKIEGV